MRKRRQTREEWEQEVWERQLNLTDNQTLRALHHVARQGQSETFSTAQLLRAILGGLLLMLGLLVSSWNIPYPLVFGLAVVIFGLCLIILAFRASSSRGHKAGQ